MKRFGETLASGILLGLSLCIQQTHGAEIRTVGGIQVDIQPVLDWKSDQKGDRPMAHWKDVQVVKFERTSAFPQVVARIDGQQKSILIRNCPTRLISALRQKAALEKNLANARKNTAQARSDAEYAATRASSEFAASGSASYVNAVANDYQTRRDDLAAAKADLAEAIANEGKLVQELNKIEETLQTEGALLAMNTGETYGNLAVWDTGMKPEL
jgi:hypothetical protein